MLKKREPSKRDSAQLGLDLYNWWQSRFNEVSGQFSKASKTATSREKNKVSVSFQNIEFITGFEESTDSPSGINFFVYFLNTNEAQTINVRGAIRSAHGRLSNIEQHIYQKIFGKYTPHVNFGEIEYIGEKYQGVHVVIPVREIPHGNKGGLSDNLFTYFRKAVISPAYEAFPKK